MIRSAKTLIRNINLPNRLHSPNSYVLALLLVSIGAIERWCLPGGLGLTPFLAFYPAIVFAAAVGGLGPGVLAIALSGTYLICFFDTDPKVIGLSDPAELSRLAVFVAGGLGVSIVSEAQLRGQERQRHQAQELRKFSQLTNLGSFMICDAKDHIVHWSDGCARLYGYEAGQAIGRISYELLQAKFPSPLEQIYAMLRREGRWEGEVKHRRRDGTWLIISVQWVLEDNAVLKICTDITRLKETEDSLRNTSEELQRSNEDLESFAYVASHDLQEPLRGITGFLNLLQQRYGGQLDDKANQYIGYATDGANRMSQLISDLLTYSRVGRHDTRRQPIQLGDVLAQALANLRAAINGALVSHDALPEIEGDPVYLRQLFQNLIGNALKFRSNERPCRIHIGAINHGSYWEFSVQDNGIGIEPVNYDRIFIIFQRLHSRQKYAGTGIGLAICKKIVERHHGRIWVESTVGQGTTFHFTLNQKQATEAASVPQPKPEFRII